MDSIARTWQRRQPETTVLYRVLAQHLETFLARTTGDGTSDDARGPLPRFVVRELRDFLACGLLARG